MGKLREWAKLAAATQLLPVMEGGEELLVGGQAVVEGIMMRSPHSYCTSIRKPNGEIVMRREPLHRPSEKHKFFKWPLLRGLGTLGQALTLGVKSLKFSTDILLAAQNEASGKEKANDHTEGAGSPLVMAVSSVSDTSRI